MRRWVILGVVFGCVGVLAAAEATRPAGRVKELFDGKSLAGWRCYLSEHLVAPADVWRVRDGLLVCRGKPMGYLYTTAGYTNFRLRVEWRWAPGTEPGNSGVLTRINGEPRPLPRCYEAQLKSGDAGDVYGFHGMKLEGDPARLKQVKDHALGGDLTGLSKMAATEKAPGQWNVYEITVEGPTITLRINGQLVNEATGAEIVSGPIGLQSEGGEIHFRKVTLTDLGQ